MRAAPGLLHASFNSGELAPEVLGRIDIKQYYAGAKYMRNAEPVPQGGFANAPRTLFCGYVRGQLAQATVASLSLAAMPRTAPGTVATITLAAAVPVCAVELASFSSTETISAGLLVEAYDGANWIAIGAALNAGSSRTRRVALPPGQSVTTASLRVRLTTDPASATIAIGAARVYYETAASTVANNLAFTFSSSQAYQIVFTSGHADVWRDGLFVGAFGHPYSSAQVPALKFVQRFDTMIIYNNDVADRRIMRMGADHEWDSSTLTLENIPKVDYGGTYTKVNDAWSIHMRFPSSGAGGGLLLVVTVNGEETPALSTGDSPVDWAAFTTSVKNAIEALPGVGAGVGIDYNFGSTHATISLEFGGENSGESFEVTSRIVNTADAAATTSHWQIADPGGEDLTSSTRGYARCGRFYQDRLVTAGFRSRTGAMLFSVTGDYFNQNIKSGSATGGILINLDTEGAEQIEHLAVGRHLVIFTSEAEYYISNAAISQTQPPNVVQCSRNGAAAQVPVVESDGGILYLARNRGLVYSAVYDDVAQSYISEPVSLLAGHLILDVVDAALQKASAATDANRYFLPRADGGMTMGVMIRNQEVMAFVRWETDGKVKSVSVDGANVPHVIVERMIGGAPRLCFEALSTDVFLDAAVERVPAGTTVSDLAMHEGAEVWAVADGFVLGPFTVEDGAIDLPFPAAAATVGRWTPPVVETLPPPREVDDRSIIRRPGRIHTVQANLIDTTSIAIGANGQAPEEVGLYFAGQPTDAPAPPFSGLIEVDGLLDFADDPTAVITQLRPGWLQVRDLTIQGKF